MDLIHGLRQIVLHREISALVEEDLPVRIRRVRFQTQAIPETLDCTSYNDAYSFTHRD
jgi:hypothetical protein